MAIGGDEATARYLDALGHPVRLQIINYLRTGERNVQQITEKVGKSQPDVSHHLQILRDAGIVERREEGTYSYYHVIDERAERILDILHLAPKSKHKIWRIYED